MIKLLSNALPVGRRRFVSVLLSGLLLVPPAAMAGAPGDDCSDGTCVPGVCAVVTDNWGQVRNSFCPAEGGGNQRCASIGRRCMTASFDKQFHSDSGRAPWYQAAIDWAKADGPNRSVKLDPTVITINADSKLPAEWPYNDGVAIRVPSGVRLRGSDDPINRTTINVEAGTRLHAIVLVAEEPVDLSGAHVPVSDVSVQDLNLIGVDSAGIERGQDCPNQGLTMTSVWDHAEFPTLMPVRLPATERSRVAYGLLVGESSTGAGPVHVSRMKIAHVGAGIAYGWNTSVQPENSSCLTNACMTLSYAPYGSNCGASGPSHKMALKLPGTPAASEYCVTEHATPSCAPTFCPVMPHEFRGNASYRSHISNNQICDTNVGINVVGGDLDVHHNSVIRAFRSEIDAEEEAGFALSSDGHVPYSQNTAWYHNYVYGFTTSFLTDGSQYIFISDPAFRSLTGYGIGDFTDYQDVTDLQQIVLDKASAHYANSDPLRGFVNGLSIRDNRFYSKPYRMNAAVTLYRTSWAWVGFNTITSELGKVEAGVRLDNSLNNWVYGNVLSGFNHGIEQSGSPGHQSYWGSCYNGLGIYYDSTDGTFTSYPNTFLDTTFNHYRKANHCRDATNSEGPGP